MTKLLEILLLTLAYLSTPTQAKKKPMNVLFIANDDLIPMIKALDPKKYSYMHTPNLDEFTKHSLVLKNSHVQQAVCSPSRTSLLFGRRPDTTKVYDLITNTREVACKDCITIPGIFTESGYFTVGMGKIFHDGIASNFSDPQSWTDLNGTTTYHNYFEGIRRYHNVSSYNVDEEKTGQIQDSQVRDHAVSWLRNLSRRDSDKPWFVAVGFRKPHLSFASPSRFFDLYPEDEIKLANNPYAPRDMPEIATPLGNSKNYPDVAATGFKGHINETLVNWKAKEEVRAYQAGVSYTDYNIGVVLDELKALGHWNDTIIVFWGDHGYKLGQHGAWCKHTNFQTDTNTPLMIRIPGRTEGGIVSDALVEHVDIMATLVEAAGLENVETCPEEKPWTVRRCTEGQSFLKLIDNPDAPWKNASYSQFPRDPGAPRSYMGYSMTTDKKLRFTAWVDFNETTSTTTFSMNGPRCGFELYDHNIDPDENTNLAYRSEYKEMVAKLFGQLKAGWRATANALLSS
eukprot:CAMPEP_0167754904 /NCGR_PEP_ID=MMETSP0110_2-20121227/8531_1 /TAXON_ID=629695 /ORGANISM="Gymnochlora sp., Strain CCMP2014" /LENGTH=512 /DNA_ID=CAMNT_0007640839 /DNA_START=19 /DNA_END=1558 /DNA_ORIENTATION=+